jgi:tetratricopeptide (TPR) repeat protein
VNSALREQMQQQNAARSSGNVHDPVHTDIPPTDAVLIHLRQGDILALQGEWAAAEAEYAFAVQANGGVAALHKLAQAQLQRRELEKAKLTIQELRRQGAKNEDILLLQVIVALRTGALDEARTLLQSAGDVPQAHYGNALIAIIQGKHDDAKRELQTTVNGWDPTLRSYARTLMGAYDEFGLFDQSTPAHLTTLLARALAQVQECELALPLLAQVLTEKSDYRDAWTVQGFCELTTERTDKALSSFEHAYGIDPEKPEIQYFMGRTYAALGEWENAATFLEYAVVNGFTPLAEAHARLATAAENASRYDRALQSLQYLIAQPDATLPTFTDAVSVAVRLGKNEDAYQIARSALERWPTEARALTLMGQAAAVSGRTDEAKANFQAALARDGSSKEAKEGLEKLSK